MQVWPMASARATIGGPSFESRTPLRNASFQRITVLSRGSADKARTTDPPNGTPGERSIAPAAPADARNCRRDIPVAGDKLAGSLRLGRPSGVGFIVSSLALAQRRDRREAQGA